MVGRARASTTSFPIRQDVGGHGRHSNEGILRCILRFIEQDLLKIDPLITHVLSPLDCQAAYDGLRNQKDLYNGVISDWNKV